MGFLDGTQYYHRNRELAIIHFTNIMKNNDVKSNDNSPKEMLFPNKSVTTTS